MADHLARARSFLFVPGHRPDRFATATAGAADVVVLDLEDAVGPERKSEARTAVRSWLAGGARAVVRINAPGTRWYNDDLAAIGDRAAGVLVPKAEEPAALDTVARRLPEGTAVIPLLETPAGIVNAAAICARPSVVRPAFGSVDLAAALGVDHRSHDALRHARSAVVLAAAAAGCAAPIDGVTTTVDDEDVLRADLDHAASLGFAGKLCVHPRQVDGTNRRFTPTDRDLHWARAVVAACADGSVAVHDGQMIDRPVLLRAQALLARSRPITDRDSGR